MSTLTVKLVLDSHNRVVTMQGFTVLPGNDGTTVYVPRGDVQSLQVRPRRRSFLSRWFGTATSEASRGTS